ncbi:MAG: ATP/GTP-binding protein [Sphaerochaeta sp.]
MLVQFVVDNFLSFGSRQEFSLFAGKTRAHQDRVKQVQEKNLLKFAALFGANASGKSNLAEAMAFMDRTIERGKLPSNCFQRYCRTKRENAERLSYFETVLVLNDAFYSYGFEALLAKGQFTSEWLIQIDHKGKEIPLFSRDLISGKTDVAWDLSSHSKQRLSLYAEDLRKDQSTLLLSMMNTGKKELYKDFPELMLLHDAFQWFSKSFNASKPFEPITRGNRYLIADKLQELTRLMEEFDTDIHGIEKIDMQIVDLPDYMHKVVENAKQDILEMSAKSPQTQEMSILLRDAQSFLCITKHTKEDDFSMKKIVFRHSDGQMYSIGEESDGTVRIMDLVEVLLTTEPRVFVIDELDRCLHPQLTYRFIQRVLKHSAMYPIQVIVTSHESRLLDLDLLRRDEVWFVEKQQGESSLYSLEEFNERIDRKIDKAYLDGRYGGVPVFTVLSQGERESE